MSVRYVLFVATNAAVIGPNKRPTGFFFPEIAHPFEALDKAGIAVEFASPLGGKPREDGFDGEDPAQTAFLNSKAYRRLSRSRKLSEVDVLDYDAVFFPGGLGPMVTVWPLAAAARSSSSSSTSLMDGSGAPSGPRRLN